MVKNTVEKVITINNNKKVKAYHYGQTIELTSSCGEKKQSIKVLANRKYLVLKTGEIKNMNMHAKDKTNNLKSVQATMRKIRRLIANNFTGGNNQLWLTLTYSKNETDPKIAYKDFKAFMEKIRVRYERIDYIAIIEPQASGSWHYHVLLKSDKRLAILNEEISNLWGKGYTKTRRIQKNTQVANRLINYLTNLDFSNENNSKNSVKGGRLFMYPKGLRIYRRSKGIKNPIEETATKQQILEENGLIERKPDFSKYKIHQTPNGEISYTTEYYNNINTAD